jgi:hypothetical protein
VESAHGVHVALPALEKLPAVHSVHSEAEALENDPAAQEEQVDTPDWTLNVPAPHAMHWVEPVVFV